jgi:hypothetical protein
MHKLARFKAAAEGGTTVPLDSDLRRCDFSLDSTAPMESRPRLGSGSAGWAPTRPAAER